MTAGVFAGRPCRHGEEDAPLPRHRAIRATHILSARERRELRAIQVGHGPAPAAVLQSLLLMTADQ